MIATTLDGLSELPRILVATIATTLIGTIFAFARFYTRAFITKNLGKDDLFILFAWISAIALTSLNSVLTEIGSEPPKINPLIPFADNFTRLAKVSYSSQMVYQFVLWSTKVAVCFFYLRIFDDKSIRWILYIVMVLITVAFTIIETLSILRCTPVSDAWDVARLDGPTCLSGHRIIYASAITNILGDLFLMAIIIPHFTRLKLPRRQKAFLILIVSLGFLVVTAAIVRLIRVVGDHPDKNGATAAADVIIWSSVEVYTGIFCASAPCIRPLLRKIAPQCLISGPGGRSTNVHHLGIYPPKSRKSYRGQEIIELDSSTEEFRGQPPGNGSSSSWVKGTRADSDKYSDSTVIQHLESAQIRKTVQVTVDYSV